MHEIQQNLLKAAQQTNLGQMTLREIGELIGVTSPQKVKHHLQQLEKRGLLRIDKATGMIEKRGVGWVGISSARNRLLSIPILGAANAGPANVFADSNIEGYLQVSPSMIRYPNTHGLFALKVDGPSMNQAEITNKRIEDGDYVVIDSEARDPKDGDIVLSIIDGLANIKKYYVDDENQQILLMSESSQSFPPIHIHQNDNFTINGKVVGVIKKPKRKK